MQKGRMLDAPLLWREEREFADDDRLEMLLDREARDVVALKRCSELLKTTGTHSQHSPPQPGWPQTW